MLGTTCGETDEMTRDSLSTWLLAIRPKTLPAAVSSVVTGTALAAHDGAFSPGPALAAFAVALLLQIGSNLANDVYDAERGTTPRRGSAQRASPTPGCSPHRR